MTIRFVRNPPLALFMANPIRGERPTSGRFAGVVGDVLAVVYRHAETGELMVHGFGPDGEAIRLTGHRDGVTIRNMDPDAITHATLYAVEQRGARTLEVRHAEGRPLWDEFPE